MRSMLISLPKGRIVNAFILWAKSRRGRVLIVSALFILLLAGAQHSDTLTSSYYALASSDPQPSWRPHLPGLPSVIMYTFRTPSNTAIQLENGTIAHVPSNLHKASPNFHLLMPSRDVNMEFCKTTLSGMIMNYPPPTIVNLFREAGSKTDSDKQRLMSVLAYLENRNMVKDEDLVLLVDGKDTWFQLPSEVLIRQYLDFVVDANRRSRSQFGSGFSQTIVFGARKTCEGFDVACRHMPRSYLSQRLYGNGTEEKAELVPARYLDAEMVVGPAKDLRELYKRAVTLFEEKKSQYQTVQSVMSTIFGEQTLARKAWVRNARSKASKWLDYVDGALPGSLTSAEKNESATLEENQQYEFSIGVDYTHTLFQPLSDCVDDELLKLVHNNRSELPIYSHENTPNPYLDLPVAFQNASGPFWAPDITRHEHSPNEKPAYIDMLEFRYALDKLKPRDTSWADIELVQNTYTGAIPAILHVTYRHRTAQTSRSLLADASTHAANITWKSLWYAGYERALLRRHFRTQQSPIEYHAAAVGGDLFWDQRGGSGGVWTDTRGLWLPWGEVDGVCGTAELASGVFEDGKGVWLHEDEDGGGKKAREEEEKKLREKIEKDKKKEEEERERDERERLEHEQREREERERLEREKEEKESAELTVSAQVE